MPDTATIDRLFLELSQFSKATTARESEMCQRIGGARSAALILCSMIESMPASEEQASARAQATRLAQLLYTSRP